ncbi:sulfur carrier protein ThiS [bacterium]|nr:sulfur carrier protein ThiS [bacterium]
MDIVVNGNHQKVEHGTSLLALLEHLQVNHSNIAIAINENIVPKSEYTTKLLNHDDKIEIIRPVGGG